LNCHTWGGKWPTDERGFGHEEALGLGLGSAGGRFRARISGIEPRDWMGPEGVPQDEWIRPDSAGSEAHSEIIERMNAQGQLAKPGDIPAALRRFTWLAKGAGRGPATALT